MNPGYKKNLNQIALENSGRYCVFRSGGCWYGVPAVATRSIVPRPQLTPVPHSDPILPGIGHVHNEFIPVISLQALTQIQYERPVDSEQQMLILLNPQNSWGLLIDQAVALAELETSVSNVADSQDPWARVAIGSASYQNNVLQVLDATELYHYASKLLDGFWQNNKTSDPEYQLTCNS